jgi:hypothetical protein
MHCKTRQARRFEHVKGILLVHPSGSFAIFHIQLRTCNHAILCCFANMAVASKKFTYLKGLQGLKQAS